MPASQEPGQAGSFWDRFFTNSPQKLQEEIHRKLNASNTPTKHHRNHNTIQDEMEDMLKAFGFGDMETAMEREFETSPLKVSPFATAFQRSSYQIHQDDKKVQVQVDAPGIAKEDLTVEVVNMPACVVQWSGQRGGNDDDNATYHRHQFATFSHRLRLGSSVDCEKLSANLSRGVLSMSAPIKKKEDQVPEIRSIPITERKE